MKTTKTTGIQGCRLIAAFGVALISVAAQCSNSVFDDAVFWFRGGKDKSGDRYMRQQGEFFDDLHANDTSHQNHQMEVQSYTSHQLADGFKANAEFRMEKVVYPSLGAQKNSPVLHLSNNPINYNGKDYFWPQYVKPYRIFADNNISDEYTVVSRLRIDEDGWKQTQGLLRIGYNGAGKGLMLGFAPASAGSPNTYITALLAPDASSGNTQFNFDSISIPTNTWVDLAVVVGNGKLRIGIATPRSSAFHGNNPTIAFAETNMWTANCTLFEERYESCYRLFCETGQDTFQQAGGTDKTCFTGSIQQMAIWGRALEDHEVMEAFGMPRPAIFRTGFDNRVSTEFGGTRSGAAQTIDGLGSWQGIWDTMLAGDEWTVNFNALRDEAGLPQIFSLRSLPDSVPANIEVSLNGTYLGTRHFLGEAHVFWPVATNLITEGANILTVRRVDNGAGSFRMDAMEIGGALGVGSGEDSITDGRVAPDRNPTGVPTAADPNLQHWSQGLQPYMGASNVHFRVWVDPDVVNKSTSRFRTRVRCYDRGDGYSIQGNETASLCVNGIEKLTHGPVKSWESLELDFAPGELHAGWNDIEFKSAPYETCHWFVAYYRFETVLPKGFSVPPCGTCISFR